jgi:hypothetical protein
MMKDFFHTGVPQTKATIIEATISPNEGDRMNFQALKNLEGLNVYSLGYPLWTKGVVRSTWPSGSMSLMLGFFIVYGLDILDRQILIGDRVFLEDSIQYQTKYCNLYVVYLCSMEDILFFFSFFL